jgi:two-component system, cell cycle sensor histidine kinase and response regulator CckA
MQDKKNRSEIASSQDLSDHRSVEEELTHNLREMTLLNKISHLISSSNSPEQVLCKTVEGIAEFLDPDLVLFFLEENDRLQLQIAGPRNSTFKLGPMPVHRVGECLCGLAARDGQAIYSLDISADPRCELAECKEAGMRSFAALPLRSGNRIIGVLGLASRTSRDFRRQSALLETLAAEISIGLRNSLLLEEANRRADELAKEIAERKQAEEALRESEIEYRMLAANLPGFVYKGFMDWSVEFYDNRVELLTGYNMHDFNSRRIKWGDLVLKEDIGPSKQAFVRALKTNRSYVREYRIKTRSECIVWIQDRGQIICDERGDIEYVSGVFFDNTDLKMTEQELKRSQALLHSTIESLPFNFFAIGKDGSYILQNSAGKKRWGNLIGKHPENLNVRPSTLSSWLEANRRAFAGEMVQDEVEYLHKRRKEIHHSIVAPIISGDEVLGILGISMDVTDRRLAEDKIRKSEKKYRELYGGLRDGSAAVNTKGIITEFNPAFQRMLGYSEGEIYKLTYEGITPEKWHDIEAKILAEQVLTRGYSDIYEKEYIRKDGSIFPVELRTYLIRGDEGNLQGMWATIRDITDRKEAERNIRESEERYRNLYRESRQREQLYESLLSSTPDAVAIYNLDGETIYVNPAFTRIFGFTIEDVQGKPIPFVPECELGKRKELFEGVLGGETVSGFDTKRLTKDGRTLEVSVSSSCYKDHEGKTAGVVMIFRDVTVLRQIERQLLHAQKMEAVGTLAGGVAHDFNNLLQAIQGYAELLLLKGESGQSGHRGYQQIIHAAKRGGELTRQLLTFSRKVESRKQPLNLNREVRQTRKLLERTIPKMIEIELRLGGDVKLIHADPVQVEQVVMNLVINAKDAMPEGGKVLIETENALLDEGYCKFHIGARPGDYALLSISDNGHGMDEETREHIFEPFYTTKETGKGTGLGLAMVYGIVEGHGGYIQCHSKPGEGTVFKIYLPVLKQPRRPQELDDETAISGGAETILLVDDEDFVRDLAEQILTDFGYTVLSAVDGESALETYRAENENVDLVILDLIMPGMGGRRCLDEIMEMNPGAKVLIASGYADDASSEGALKNAVKGFLRKPYTLQQMLLEVRRVLDEEKR